MPQMPAMPQAVRSSLEVWLSHHDRLLPGLIDGLYVVGSSVLDDWQDDSDIDVIAFTSTTPGTEQVEAMANAHADTISELGAVKIDGPRLLWTDIAADPVPVVRPWSLDGEFHHDDGCFEINPVMWFTLASYGQTVRGPQTCELSIATDTTTLITFVQENTATYWRSVAEGVTAAANDPLRDAFAPEMTAWAVLGVARMLFTVRNGDVASKSAAGRWLADEHPKYRELIDHALGIRRGTVGQPDSRETALSVAAYMDTVIGLVAESDHR